MNPFLIKAGIVIVATVVYTVWSYSRRQTLHCQQGNSPQSPKFDGSSTKTCTICYDSLAIINDNANVTLPCKHKFHLNCIKQMHNNGGFKSCPNCRRKVSLTFVEDVLKKQAFTKGPL